MRPRRPYLAQTPIALAHRGGAHYGPNLGLENTLAAFRTAAELGYTHVETDVQLTRDGQLVAFHDDRLDRVTDRTGRIRDLTREQLRAARVGDSEPIPLLTDVLDELPQLRLNIDLKARGTAGPLWQLVEERGLHDLVCVGSFSQREIGAFRRLAGGRVATAAGRAGAALMRLGPPLLSRLLRTPADVFQVPSRLVVGGREVTIVTRRFVETAHLHDRQIHVWTVDDPDEMRRLLDLGVDGLVSDRIDVLKGVLTERGQWTGAG